MPDGVANGCSTPRTVSRTNDRASTWLTANRDSTQTSLTTCTRSLSPTKSYLVLILKHHGSDLKGSLIHDNDFTNHQDQADYGLG
jgi:hypothetical protein